MPARCEVWVRNCRRTDCSGFMPATNSNFRPWRKIQNLKSIDTNNRESLCVYIYGMGPREKARVLDDKGKFNSSHDAIIIIVCVDQLLNTTMVPY
jgi:hypothetical protein